MPGPCDPSSYRERTPAQNFTNAPPASTSARSEPAAIASFFTVRIGYLPSSPLISGGSWGTHHRLGSPMASPIGGMSSKTMGEGQAQDKTAEKPTKTAVGHYIALMSY